MRTDYVMYGWKLPKEIQKNIDIWEEKYLPYIEGHKDQRYSIIYDGMCDDYIVFGLEIIKIDDDVEIDGFKYLDITYKLDKRNLMVLYKKLFNTDPKDYPKLFMFRHIT